MNKVILNYATGVCVLATVTMGAVLLAKKSRKKRNRKVWARSWLRRRSEGRDVLSLLNSELKSEDPQAYRNFLRLTDSQFEYILELIGGFISKEDTVMREAIPARSKLEVTLRFLATGETFRSLMYNTRIHETTISKFIPEVCKAMRNALQVQYMKTPNTIEEWLLISRDFNAIWQFPHCLGALDGKHVEFRAPISCGSYFHNYKGSHSVVLLGLVDANYKFIYVNIGVNGRTSDGGVFQQSGLSRGLMNNTLNIPAPLPLPGQQLSSNYVIVADEAFPLLPNVMKPYPLRNLSRDKRIFNYRLSRARRTVEHAFGILANRFRIFLKPIALGVDKVEVIILTCVLLHNYMATTNGNAYTDDLEENIQPLRSVAQEGSNRSSDCARHLRDNLKNFFNFEIGSVPWQNSVI